MRNKSTHYALVLLQLHSLAWSGQTLIDLFYILNGKQSNLFKLTNNKNYLP